MKVFEIFDTLQNKTYYISNKNKFCSEFGLTRRLLDYTYTGQRHHHKGFILKNKLEFIPSIDGEKLLYDSNELGYFIYPADYVKNKSISNDIKDCELKQELIKANKKIQNLSDKLRINKKLVREQDRNDNIQENFIKDVVDILKLRIETDLIYNKDENDIDKEKCKFNLPKEMIVQVSDVHFGKVVNLPVNTFNFDVAKRRFKKYSDRVNYYVNKYNIDKITLVFTGDLINLDSHIDSLLSNENNRANSFVEALDTLVDFINNIRENVSCVNVVGVTGNESRLRTNEYHSNVDKIANNNFDMLLCKILNRLFKNTNVNFINECDVLNYVFKVGRFNVAITHGDKLGKQSKDDILKFKTRMIEATNNSVDYVLFGHIHESLITSSYSRSGSLCGMDEYAYNGLNITNGIASQNIYLVENEGITGIEIKL